MITPRFRTPPIRASEITSEQTWLRRREIVKMLGLGLSGLAAGCRSESAPGVAAQPADVAPSGGKPLAIVRRGEYRTDEAQTSYKDATHYNNYYEFGTDKSDPARSSGRFKPLPWRVEIAGHAEVTGRFTLEDILKPHALEERIYRHRCVEGWSMVIPW